MLKKNVQQCMKANATAILEDILLVAERNVACGQLPHDLAHLVVPSLRHVRQKSKLAEDAEENKKCDHARPFRMHINDLPYADPRHEGSS